MFSVISPDSRQNKVSGRLRELVKKKFAFSSVRALRSLLLPGRLLTVPVSRNFLNSLLKPSFVQLFSRNLSVNLFAVYLFKYKLFIKILSLSETRSDVCCDDFRCHRLIAKVNK